MEEVIEVTPIDKSNVSVTKTVSDNTTTTYSFEFLYSQKQQILRDKQSYIEARDSELAFIDSILPSDYTPPVNNEDNQIG